MTDHPTGRDFEPPPRRPAVEPPWELAAGHNLEDVYCAYAEWQVILTRGFPDVEIARLRDMAGWSGDKLREAGADSALLDRFEEALSGLPSMGDFPASIDDDWLAARKRVSLDVERLLEHSRTVIARHRLRYYDYGVMLCRIRLCLRMLRVIATLPAEFIEALPDLTSLYRKELLRVTGNLAALVEYQGSDWPHDPEHHELDQKFSAFAEYLSSWRTDDAEPTPALQEHLDAVMEVAGFRKGVDSFNQERAWAKHSEPLPEAERMPLPVPHSTEEREQLESYWEETRGIATNGEVERARDLMESLLAICRAVLGPVDSLTLHVQADYASMRAVGGQAAFGVLMLLDIARTAQHYYSPYHPARYLISAHAHSYLRFLEPSAAQEVYDFPLKGLVEREESSLPPALHQARRTIRGALGMDAPTKRLP